MATWGLHLRVAEALLKHLPGVDVENFLIGNIGPDCGKPNSDWSSFDPPSHITHWLDDNGIIRTEDFYSTHLLDEFSCNIKGSYLLGYYVHLLTDKLWREDVDQKKVTDNNYAKLLAEPQFIWTIKKDWYDLDRLYFHKNPNSIFYTHFQHIKEFSNDLDYFPKDATINQIKYITEFYLQKKESIFREYIYLTESEMDTFVETTLLYVHQKLSKLDYLRIL